MGANPTVIRSWFTLLDKIKKTAGITSPDQIWSGDETGVQNVPKEVKVLGLKNMLFPTSLCQTRRDIYHFVLHKHSRECCASHGTS